MSIDLGKITSLFTGTFLVPAPELQQRLRGCKAYIFDWDGVFNDGFKDEKGSSAFSEIDAMGTNLLRFSHFLQEGTAPYIAVITGEGNRASFSLAEREHFHSVYFSIRHKEEALKHFCRRYGLKESEVAFVFDDVLDLSAAKLAGLRVMVPHAANPLFREWVIQENWVDYLTGCEGHEHAVRETSELFMGLRGNFEEAVGHRMQFSSVYQQYLQQRQSVSTHYFTADSQNSIQPFQP
ncbi:MAG: hypothetical protein RL732_1118 [Bacteroidota bacterium]|jgi:3-deoxy-D-manno-octulosonate 8-phosphate phosphatase (KDO 8-P phosphatase)